jgi:hypothetical protein
VICANGETYSNTCLAACAGQTDCESPMCLPLHDTCDHDDDHDDDD